MSTTSFRRLAGVLAGMLAVGALAGCGSEDSSGGEEPITLALITTLSGGSAQIGVETRNGANLAIAEINDAGGIDGRPLKLKEYDGQQQPEVVVRSATRAASSDGAIAIIGPQSSGEGIALAPVAERLKIPFITNVGAANEITEGQPYAFRTTVVNSELAHGVAALAIDQGAKRPALLHDNGSFGATFAKVTADGFKELGTPAVANEEFPVNATDLTAQVQKLKAANVDAVAIGCSSASDAGLAIRQMAAAGLTVPVYGTSCNLATDAAKAAGDALNEVAVYGLLGFDVTKPAAQEFVKSYEDTYDPATSYEFAAAAYDAVKMLAEALEASGGEGGEKLKSALENVTGHQPVLGAEGSTMDFSATKHDALSGDYLTPYKLLPGGKTERVQ